MGLSEAGGSNPSGIDKRDMVRLEVDSTTARLNNQQQLLVRLEETLATIRAKLYLCYHHHHHGDKVEGEREKEQKAYLGSIQNDDIPALQQQITEIIQQIDKSTQPHPDPDLLEKEEEKEMTGEEEIVVGGIGTTNLKEMLDCTLLYQLDEPNSAFIGEAIINVSKPERVPKATENRKERILAAIKARNEKNKKGEGGGGGEKGNLVTELNQVLSKRKMFGKE